MKSEVMSYDPTLAGPGGPGFKDSCGTRSLAGRSPKETGGSGSRSPLDPRRRVYSWFKRNGVYVPSDGSGQALRGGCGLAWIPAGLAEALSGRRKRLLCSAAVHGGPCGRMGIDPERIMVGGESAGGGLAAAVCMLARDRKEIRVACQMPLYPMLSNIDTESSKNNHGRVWNTRRNHIGWWFYLRGRAKKKVSPYASPAWQTDYKGLPPAYTFVGEGEPFYAETLQYVENLRKAGVPAEVDVYPTNMHAFDMLQSKKELSRKAAAAFLEHFEKAMKRNSSKAPQDT